MSKKYPMVDVTAAVTQDMLDSVKRTITEDGRFFNGSFIKMLEKHTLGDVLLDKGGYYGACVSNGTSAIYLALKALGIGKGDLVATTAFTFIATVEAILMTGAEPILIDIENDSPLMDLDILEQYLWEGNTISALVPVHLYGLMVDMVKVTKLAEKYGFKVVEDCAQAHLSLSRDGAAGSFGDAAAFSFFPGKTIGAFGDAGAVLSSNKELIDKVKILSNHGRTGKYVHDIFGFNFRMDEIQAIPIYYKLQMIDKIIDNRWNIVSCYNKEFDYDFGIKQEINRIKPSYHLYVMKVCNKRDELVRLLNERGIGAGIHYPLALSQQPSLEAYYVLTNNNNSTYEAETLAKKVISLPIHPHLTIVDVEKIAKEVKSFCQFGEIKIEEWEY